MYTIPEATPIKFNKYQGKSIKRHPLLPARKFEKGGREIDVTAEVLAKMASNLKIRRPITIAHPDLDKAEAVGWIVPGTAEVSAFGDGQALYVGVEWSEQAAQAISDRKYGYISPVFAMKSTSESGEDIGPALLAAGLTNNPHWSEDQPELWEQFTASFEQKESAGDAAIVDNRHEEEDMEKLEQANARIQELEASLSELTAERDKLAEDLGNVQKRVEEFTADDGEKGKQVAELQAQVKKMKGDALLAEFSHKLREKHLVTNEGEDTPLKMAAYDAPDQFRFMVGLIQEPANANVEPVGSSEEVAVQMTASERAHERAVKAADAGEMKFDRAYLKFLAEEKSKEDK